MKWSTCTSSLRPLLAVVTASSQLVIYGLDNDRLELLCCQKVTGDSSKPLVILSVDWNDRIGHAADKLSLAISDSDGQVCTWDFNEGQLTQTSSRKPHNFEAWITVHDAWNPNVIYSGSDDCKLVISDLRIEGHQITSKRTHDAGVTSLLSDVTIENRLFSGRYSVWY